jgi:hypothetical protein
VAWIVALEQCFALMYAEARRRARARDCQLPMQLPLSLRAPVRRGSSTTTEAARPPFTAGAPPLSAGVESRLLTSEDARQLRTRTMAPGRNRPCPTACTSVANFLSAAAFPSLPPSSTQVGARPR